MTGAALVTVAVAVGGGGCTPRSPIRSRGSAEFTSGAVSGTETTAAIGGELFVSASIRCLVSSLVVGPKTNQKVPLLKIPRRATDAKINQERATAAASDEATSMPDADHPLSNE